MQDESIDAYLDTHRQQFEDDLFELLRFASVSADPKYTKEVRKTAENCRSRFEALGLATEMIETPGHPLVYAESPAVPGAPIALVYGHYDVQRPSRSTSGSARRSSPRSATAMCMPAVPRTTKARC
jgi:succinyl-diaminopimelate desuccinylase